MNTPRRRAAHVVPLTVARRNADLAIDTLGLLLLRIGESAPAILAWMLHENIRTLVHHPPDIAASLAWLVGFTLLSLSARLTARRLRERQATEKSKDLIFD